MASYEYHLKQAQISAQLALAESDPAKGVKLHILALEHFDKAEKAKADNQPSPPEPPDYRANAGKQPPS